MARRGRAELAVIITAQNEAAAVLKDLQNQVKEVEKSTQGLSKATDGGTQKAKGLAGAWKNVVKEGEQIDKVRSRVEMMRSIVVFAIPVVAGLVAALVEMATAKVPVDEVAESLKGIEAASRAAKDAVFDMMEAQGLLTKEQVETEKIRRLIKSSTEELRKAEVELFKVYDVQKMAIRELEEVRRGDLLFSIDSEEELTEAVDFATKALRRQHQEYDDLAASVRRLNDALRKSSEIGGFEGPPESGITPDSDAPIGETADDKIAEAKKIADAARRKRAAAAREAAARRKAAVAALQEEAKGTLMLGAGILELVGAQLQKNELDEKALELSKQIAEQAEETAARLEGGKSEAEMMEELAEATRLAEEELAKYRETWMEVADVLANAMDVALPGVGNAVADLTKTWSEYAAGQSSVAGAVAGTVDAVGNAIASQIEDETALMAILAIKELGLGISMMFIPGFQAESASHFAAAAIFGGAAIASAVSGGTAGASSGGEESAASEGTGTGGGGGGVTYIFNSGVVDGQGVQLALARADRSSAGTGLAQRRGV